MVGKAHLERKLHRKGFYLGVRLVVVSAVRNAWLLTLGFGAARLAVENSAKTPLTY